MWDYCFILARHLYSEAGLSATHLDKRLIICMVVDVGLTKNYSQENPKISVVILDFGRHLGFQHVKTWMSEYTSLFTWM